MHSSLADILHAWHDFYLLSGTASATLLGLMFVAASIGASVFTEKDRAPMRAFLSPTAVHFSAVLFICILAAIPSHTWLTLSVLLALGGAAGVIYSSRVWVELFVRHRFNVDLIDRMLYAFAPVLGYLLILVAAALLLLQWSSSLDVLAAALVALLLAAVRNAWDMMIWLVIRVPVPERGNQA